MAGRPKAWLSTGWLALGLAGCVWAVAAFWPSPRNPHLASMDFFFLYVMGTVAIVAGASMAFRSRWRPLVAALRDTLGEPTMTREADRREPKRRAMIREDLLQQSAIGVLVFVACAIDLGDRPWGVVWASGGLVAALALFAGGYALASRRWRPFVDEALRSGPS